MPFCRKCGRRIPEYSESCPDCKMSTTAPMINVRKITSSRASKAASSTNIAEAITVAVPKVTFTAKTVAPAAHQTQRQPPQQRQHSPVTDWLQPKVTILDKPAAPKPVLSAKHIVKPKKATPRKQPAPFTIVFNKPAATPKVVQHESVLPLIPINQPTPVAEPKPAALAIPAAPPEPAVQTEPAPPSIPITPAPVIPPHEIKQSNVSLKEDLLANPDDYEKEAFDFDLKCVNGHFWRAGRSLPVSNGKAYCLKCGERLSKPKRFKQNRYHRY